MRIEGGEDNDAGDERTAFDAANLAAGDGGGIGGGGGLGQMGDKLNASKTFVCIDDCADIALDDDDDNADATYGWGQVVGGVVADDATNGSSGGGGGGGGSGSGGYRSWTRRHIRDPIRHTLAVNVYTSAAFATLRMCREAHRRSQLRQQRGGGGEGGAGRKGENRRHRRIEGDYDNDGGDDNDVDVDSDDDGGGTYSIERGWHRKAIADDNDDEDDGVGKGGGNGWCGGGGGGGGGGSIGRLRIGEKRNVADAKKILKCFLHIDSAERQARALRRRRHRALVRARLRALRRRDIRRIEEGTRNAQRLTDGETYLLFCFRFVFSFVLFLCVSGR
jgi:hypothetical protein